MSAFGKQISKGSKSRTARTRVPDARTVKKDLQRQQMREAAPPKTPTSPAPAPAHAYPSYARSGDEAPEVEDARLTLLEAERTAARANRATRAASSASRSTASPRASTSPIFSAAHALFAAACATYARRNASRPDATAARIASSCFASAAASASATASAVAAARVESRSRSRVSSVSSSSDTVSLSASIFARCAEDMACAETSSRFADEARALSTRLTRLLALSLDLPEDAFALANTAGKLGGASAKRGMAPSRMKARPLTRPKLLLKKVLKFIPLVLGQKKEAQYLLNEME